MKYAIIINAKRITERFCSFNDHWKLILIHGYKEFIPVLYKGIGQIGKGDGVTRGLMVFNTRNEASEFAREFIKKNPSRTDYNPTGKFTIHEVIEEQELYKELKQEKANWRR